MTSRAILVAAVMVCVVDVADGQVAQPYYAPQQVVGGAGEYVSDALPMTAPGVPSGQVGMPGIQYSGAIAAGDGGQLYPYDRQDPWLHGHFQRVPAYGGFASFRPYNYRHVYSQTQLANAWGMSHGMPYSQQFWNKYRSSYLNGNLHSQPAAASSESMYYQSRAGVPATSASYPVQLPAAPTGQYQSAQPQQRPIHLLPQR